MSEILSTHFFPKTIAATGSYAVASPGRKLVTTIKADSGARFVSMGPAATNASNLSARRFRGVEFCVASDAADNTTGTIRVYRVVHSTEPDESSKAGADYDFQLIGTLSYTIGSQLGLGGTQEAASIVPDDCRMADTMVWENATVATTPKGIADYIASQFSSGASNDVYSPADNTTALCNLPDVGNGDLYFDVNAANGVRVIVVVRKFT